MQNRYTKCIVPTRKSDYLQNDFSVIILAARPNTRMKSYGSPSLFKIGDQFLIQKQVQNILKIHPNIDIILVSGFEIDKVIKRSPSNVRIIENINYNNTNECADIKLGIQACITKSALLVNGNTLFDDNAINQISTIQSVLIVDQNKQIINNIGITIVDGKPTILSYGIEQPQWCNICYLTIKDLQSLYNYCKNTEHYQHFMFEGLNHILTTNHSITTLNPQYMSISILGCSKGLKKNNENIISER